MRILGRTPHWSARSNLGLVVVLALALVVARLGEMPIGAVTDDAYYVEMARSLANGLGPVIDTGPDRTPYAPQVFPPGFPLLLSLVARVLPHSLNALKVVPLLGLVLLLPLSLWLPGPDAEARERLAVAAVVVLNPWVVAWSGRILSDVPFAALSLGALLFFLRLEDRSSPSRRARIVLILLCAAAVSVRTIGWAAVLAMAVYLVAQRRYLPAVLLPVAVALVLLASWIAWSGGDGPISEGYATQIFSHQGVPAWRFALDNTLRYVAQLPVVLVPLFGEPVAAVMARWHMAVLYPAAAFTSGVILLLLAGRTVVRGWRDPAARARVRLFTFYLAIYGVVLAHFDGYPSGVQSRLLIPLLPILAWLVLAGTQRIGGDGRHRLWRLVLGLLLVAALGHNVWRIARPLRTSVASDGRGYVDPGQGAAWLRDHAAPGTVVLVQEPLVRHVHYGGPVVGTGDDSAATVAAIIARYEPRYLWLGPEVHGLPHRLGPAGNALLAIARRQPQMFELVYQDTLQSTYIFAIGRP